MVIIKNKRLACWLAGCCANDEWVIVQFAPSLRLTDQTWRVAAGGGKNGALASYSVSQSSSIFNFPHQTSRARKMWWCHVFNVTQPNHHVCTGVLNMLVSQSGIIINFPHQTTWARGDVMVLLETPNQVIMYALNTIMVLCIYCVWRKSLLVHE